MYYHSNLIALYHVSMYEINTHYKNNACILYCNWNENYTLLKIYFLKDKVIRTKIEEF